MATWSDVERNSTRFEALDTATLQEFLKVPPPVSQNPTFNIRFEQTMQRVRDVLSQRAREAAASSEDHRHQQTIRWTKIGVVIALVIGAATLIPRCTSSHPGAPSPTPATSSAP
jgi:hypothetical protein